MNAFDNDDTTTSFRFEEKTLNMLMPGRRQGDTRIVFLELVKQSRGKNVWFGWEPPDGKMQPGMDTTQLIEITIKRIK